MKGDRSGTRAPYTISPITVQPGTVGTGWLEVARSPSGSTIGIPLVVLHGRQEGRTLLVDGATHGDEGEGPLALLSLIRDTDPQTLRGTLIVVPALNIPAFEAGARGNPMELHDYDLNRTFPGAVSGGITARVAARYAAEVAARADAVISLHGGGSVFVLAPYVIADLTVPGAMALVRAMGWARFTDNPEVGQSAHRGTLAGVCAARGIPALTAEMGGAGHRSPAHLREVVAEYLRGVRNVMIHLDMIDGTPRRPDRLARIAKHNFRANAGGLIELAHGIDLDAAVEESAVVMRISSLFGEVVEEVRAPYAGRVMGLPAGPVAYPGRIIGSIYKIEEELC